MSPPSPSACLLIVPFFLVHVCTTLASEAALEMGAPDPIAECTEGTFTWQGGRPPYTLSVSGFDPNTLLFEKTNLSDTVFNWFASVAANTLLTVELMDTSVDGASGARISNSFIIQPGSDSCLAAASSSTAQQAADSTSSSPSSSPRSGQRTTTSASSTPPVSTSASRTNVDTDTVTAAPSPSPTNSSSSRTLPGSTAFSTTGPVGASTTSQPGSASASASASSTQPSGSPDPSSQDGQSGPTGAQGGGPFAPGAIAGVAVASLVAGFGLATGFFCLWRRSRRKSHRASCTGERRGGLESCDYPATDVVLTRPASPPLGHRGALDFERGHNAHPVAVHDRLGKARQDGFLPPSTQMQRATFPRPNVMIWEDAEPSRLVDSLAEECRGTGDLVGRRWPDSGDPDEEFVYSEGSTAPPPYSQVV